MRPVVGALVAGCVQLAPNLQQAEQETDTMKHIEIPGTNISVPYWMPKEQRESLGRPISNAKLQRNAMLATRLKQKFFGGAR